jgi:uncharacterized protein (DUF2062 family)
MPRQFLKRILPQRNALHEQWYLRPFRALLNDPALWALHRRNVLRAVTVGIIAAFVPIPGQTAIAAVLAIYLRVNLPVAIFVSWMSNPLTMGPLYYTAYRVGLLVLGRTPTEDADAFSLDELWEDISEIWAPLLVGCALTAAIVAAIAWIVLNRVWVASIRRRQRARAARDRT